jgi:hypothetical protein
MSEHQLNFDLKAPMDYETFRMMPEQWQRKYLQWLHDTFAPTDDQVARMFGCSKNMVYLKRRMLHVPGRKPGPTTQYTRERNDKWEGWLNG